MAKKLRPPEPTRTVHLIRVVTDWTTKWAWVGIGAVVLLMASLMLAARFDPSRRSRRQEEERALQAAKVRAEAALAAQPEPEIRNGVANLTFKALEFMPLANHSGSKAEIAAFAAHAPWRVRKFDHQQVRITGFALPTRYERGRVQDFLILANQMTCCYGFPPRFCDFILAHVEQGVDSPRMDIPTSFEGTLHVQDRYANGTWLALYSMDCTKVTADPRP